MKELSPQDFEHWDEEDDEGEKQWFSKPKPLSPETLKLLRENNRKSFKQWQFKEVFGVKFKVLFRKGLLVRDGDLWRVDYNLMGGHEDQWLRFEAYDPATAWRYKAYVTAPDYLTKNAPQSTSALRKTFKAILRKTTIAKLKVGDRFKNSAGNSYEVLRIVRDGDYLLITTDRCLPGSFKRCRPDTRVWIEQ